MRTYMGMRSFFIETEFFKKYRADYLTDDHFVEFQKMLMEKPTAGAVTAGTGGLRKVRFADPRRGKGRRGGLRTIYYWQDSEDTFWLFMIYDKDEMEDLTDDDKKLLKKLLKDALAVGK